MSQRGASHGSKTGAIPVNGGLAKHEPAGAH